MDPFLITVLVLLVGAMWFMSNRSRKQQQKAQEFRNNLKPGDEVMTGSGLFGTVVAVEDDVITLESTPGSQTRWLKAAIAKLIEPPVADDEEADEEEAEGEDDEYDEDSADYEYEDDEYEDEEAEELDGIEVPDDLSGLDDSTKPTKPEDPDTKDTK